MQKQSKTLFSTIYNCVQFESFDPMIYTIYNCVQCKWIKPQCSNRFTIVCNANRLNPMIYTIYNCVQCEWIKPNQKHDEANSTTSSSFTDARNNARLEC